MFDKLDNFGLTILRTIAARSPLGSAAEGRPRRACSVEHLTPPPAPLPSGPIEAGRNE
jgi:hypothetical protein